MTEAKTTDTTESGLPIRRILNIEGGGIKGLIPVSALEYFEDAFGVQCADAFDLMAGTSTGAIIAAGLAARMPAREIREFYEKEGPRIFRQKWWHPKALRGIFGAAYSPKHLQKVVGELLGDKRLDALGDVKLIVPTVTTQGKIAVFKTPHLDDSHAHSLDADKTLDEIVMCSVSAPLFFPAHTGSDGIAYTDGGLFALNPIICALKEGMKYLGWVPEQMRILSLGCGAEPLNVKKNLGLLRAGSDILPLIFQAQVTDANNNADLLMGEHALTNIVRIDPGVNVGRYATDNTDAVAMAEMRSIGCDDARAVIDRVGRLFFAR